MGAHLKRERQATPRAQQAISLAYGESPRFSGKSPLKIMKRAREEDIRCTPLMASAHHLLKHMSANSTHTQNKNGSLDDKGMVQTAFKQSAKQAPSASLPVDLPHTSHLDADPST